MSELRPETAKAGKTLAMVNSLPEAGAMVVVHNGPMRDYLRRMIRDLRGRSSLAATQIIVISQSYDTDRLQGCLKPIFIDHAFWPNVSRGTAHRTQQLCDSANSRHKGQPE